MMMILNEATAWLSGHGYVLILTNLGGGFIHRELYLDIFLFWDAREQFISLNLICHINHVVIKINLSRESLNQNTQ